MGAMDADPRTARRRRRHWLILALGTLVPIGLALILFARTPAGSAFLNVAEYRLRLTWWSLIGGPEYDPARTGGLSGVIPSLKGMSNDLRIGTKI